MNRLITRKQNHVNTINLLARIYPSKAFILLMLLAVSLLSWPDESFADNPELIPAIVLDFELLGDTSIESVKAQDAMLLEKYSKQLRQLLTQERTFKVLDDKRTLALLEKASQGQYLHRCNGCELSIGKQVGAKVVVVPWVFRMSLMIQVMNFEIRDVQSGKLILKRPYDFRGNNEKSWDRAMRYALKDIKAAAARIQN